MPTQFTPVGLHTSVSSLSGAKTIAVPANANAAIIQAITQNVRISLGTNDPTTTLGFQIRAGDPAVRIPVPPGGSIRVIEETGSATVQVQFVRVYDASGRG